MENFEKFKKTILFDQKKIVFLMKNKLESINI